MATTVTRSPRLIDVRALYPLMALAVAELRAEKVRAAKSRPENKRADVNSKRVTTPA